MIYCFWNNFGWILSSFVNKEWKGCYNIGTPETAANSDAFRNPRNFLAIAPQVAHCYLIWAYLFTITKRHLLYESKKLRWIDWYCRKIHLPKITISADKVTIVYVYVYIYLSIYIYIYICMYMYMCICVCICEYIYWWNNDGWLYNERQYLGVARSVLRVSVFKWKIWKTETLETTCFTPKWGLHLCFQPLLFIHAKIITCTLFFSYMYIQIYRYVCISLCIHICI